MKKRFGIYCLSSLAILGLISSCNPATSSSSPISSSSDNSEPTSFESSSFESSSSIDGNYNLWSKADQALMVKYCGEILPYPIGLVSGKVTVKEIIDEDSNYSYLEIYDESNSFTLEKYYELLAQFNWSPIQTYLGRIVRTDSYNNSYVELTKGNENTKTGYDIIYYFASNHVNEDDQVASANVLRCYSDFSYKSTDETSWTSSQLDTIKDVTTIELPYINLGEVNTVSAYSLDILQIYDYYVTDLTIEYANLLENNGFTINTGESKLNDSFILEKELDNGSIRANLSYYNGNNFIFTYTPKETTYTSWPTQIINEIKEKSGVEIPEFPIKEGGNYKVYVKNNTYCIYTTTKDDTFNYETYNDNILQFVGFTWEETISFISYNLTDNYDNSIGYKLIAKVSTPTSTFTSSWPSLPISDFFSSIGIDVKLPEFNMDDLVETGKQIKYKVKGEATYNEWYDNYYKQISQNPDLNGLSENATEEEIVALAKELAFQEQGVDVYLFDTNSSAYNSFENTLYKAGWYSYFGTSGSVTYEDPTGKLAVTLDGGTSDPSHDGQGQTSFLIHPGTNKTHSPEFEFKEKEVEAGIGLTTQLELNKNMLPYDVTYSSSDTSGKISVNEKGEVKVASDVVEGTSATISATLTDSNGKTYTASCTVTAKKVTNYTSAVALDLIGNKLIEKGYNPTINHKIVGDVSFETDYLTLVLDSSTDISEFKKSIATDFILDGFETDSSWEESDIYIMDKLEIMPGEYINYSLINTYCNLTAEYSLHVENNQTILQIVVY